MGHFDLRFVAEDLVLEEDLAGSLQEVNLEVTLIDENGYLVSYKDLCVGTP